MARNGLGTYSLPAGNPVITGTTISSTAFNNTMNDIAAALTQSVSADGQTPFTGPIQLAANSTLATSPPAGDNTTKIATSASVALQIAALAQAPLGFTPVQQGTGVAQNQNPVKIGYNVGLSRLKATVDSTDLGAFTFESAANVYSALQTLNAGAAINGATLSATTIVNSGGSGGTFSYRNADTGFRVFLRCGASGGQDWVDNAFTNVIAAISNTGAFTAAASVSAPLITQTSDEHKKTNWRALTDAQLDALANLEISGVFDWKDGSGTSIGGPAQSIQAIVPEAVHTDENGELSVNYGGLCFAMQQATLRRLWGKK